MSALRRRVVSMITFTFDDDTYEQLPRHIGDRVAGTALDVLMRAACHVQRDDLVLKDRAGRGPLTFLNPTQTSDSGQPQFEYLWVGSSSASNESSLNERGSGGWEAVCVNKHGDLLMKRLKGSK